MHFILKVPEMFVPEFNVEIHGCGSQHTPEALPPWSFLTTSVTSSWVMKESNCESPASASTRECVIEEILEVLLPPPKNVPSQGQQLPTPTVNSVGKALCFPLLRRWTFCQNRFEANR
ncbi:hypothetical protein AMECASPLE_036750 [Ameca splendens]|uniref:Uncharacterized protein n=1 Tax=Ameca splendens TaxID=208324 RepID=A0ABV0XKR8_9TELE